MISLSSDSIFIDDIKVIDTTVEAEPDPEEPETPEEPEVEAMDFEKTEQITKALTERIRQSDWYPDEI